MYQFVEIESGSIKIFKLPVPGMTYTMGLDAATGLGVDYSCGQIVSNALPCEQVAVFRQQCQTHVFSEMMNMLGKYYYDALNVCEINYPGNSVQETLLQYYRYPRNYQAESHLDENVDITSRYGYRTTEASKWLLIHETQIALATQGLIINDVVTINEFMNFVYQYSKHKAGAAAGFCDDTVIALMLAYHGAKLYPCVMPVDEEKNKVTKLDADSKRNWRLFREKITGTRSREKEGVQL